MSDADQNVAANPADYADLMDRFLRQLEDNDNELRRIAQADVQYDPPAVQEEVRNLQLLDRQDLEENRLPRFNNNDPPQLDVFGIDRYRDIDNLGEFMHGIPHFQPFFEVAEGRRPVEEDQDGDDEEEEEIEPEAKIQINWFNDDWRALTDLFKDGVQEQAQPMTPRCECKICLSDYSTTRIPRMLSNCGHSICEECAGKLLRENGNGRIRCPFCRAVSVVKGTVEQMPKNYSLMEVIGI